MYLLSSWLISATARQTHMAHIHCFPNWFQCSVCYVHTLSRPDALFEYLLVYCWLHHYRTYSCEMASKTQTMSFLCVVTCFDAVFHLFGVDRWRPRSLMAPSQSVPNISMGPRTAGHSCIHVTKHAHVLRIHTYTYIHICKYTYIHVYTYPRWWVWERGSKDTVRDDPPGPSDRKQTIRKRFWEQGSKVAVRDDPPGPNDRKQTIRKRFHDFRVRVVQSRKKTNKSSKKYQYFRNWFQDCFHPCQ